MEWNQGLFVAFMAAVVGNLLLIQLQIHDVKKRLKPKARRGDDRDEDHRDRSANAKEDALR